MRDRTSTIGLLACAAMAAAALSSQPVLAHAKLQSSEPAGQARLAMAPTTLTLKFSERAQLAALKLKLGGRELPIIVDRGAKAALSFTVPLPALGAGTYEVDWSALAADDGHLTKGSFTFVVLDSKPSSP